MGTNFYLRSVPECLGRKESYWCAEPSHIGKRSAAGLYCWDCGESLCVAGESRVHSGCEFRETCPKCGKTPATEGMAESAAGRELGFATGGPSQKTGVRSCSSFTWAIARDDFELAIKEIGKPLCPNCDQPFPDGKPIKDEYGDTYSMEDFLAVLSECPIQFIDSIGHEFT